jgi:hypothetical protein
MRKTTTVLENGISFDITRKENQLIVSASVPKRNLATQKKVSCNTTIVLNTLQENGINAGTLVEGSGLVISNSKTGKELNGRWVFEIPTTKTTTRANNRSKTKKASTTNKTDKEIPITGKNKLFGTEDVE